MIAWHYTVGLTLPLICESGVLRPTDALIGRDERPVLWFSTNPFWEPTSAKMIARSMKEQLESEDGLPFRTLSMYECAEGCDGLYRFGLPAAQLIKWPEVGKRAGISAPMRNAIIQAGHMQGANPSQWYGTFEEIPIDGLLLQQLVDFRRWETKERIACREKQLAQIAALEIHVQALPLAELQEKAGSSSFRDLVNYAYHRLTNYHRLLERFDGGDRAILNAIRMKVYAAIAGPIPNSPRSANNSPIAPRCSGSPHKTDDGIRAEAGAQARQRPASLPRALSTAVCSTASL
jgi:hypothetical protein